MKLTIVRLQHLTAQERSDLQKIWPLQDIPALEQRLDNCFQLYSARFNGRLLAAVQVAVTGDSATLSQLTVREETRRRGVGKYLLDDTLAQNPQILRWVIVQDGSETADVIASFMTSAGGEPLPDGQGYSING